MAPWRSNDRRLQVDYTCGQKIQPSPPSAECAHPCSGESATAFRNDRRQSLLLLEALAGHPPPLFGHESLLLDSSQLGRFSLQLLLLKFARGHGNKGPFSCALQSMRGSALKTNCSSNGLLLALNLLLCKGR